MYTHIVFFKLKEANEENINLFKETLLSMEGNIDTLKYVEVGIDELKTERSFHLSLITRFDNKEDYLEYSGCDYHVNNVLAIIKPYIEISKTVDYFS